MLGDDATADGVARETAAELAGKGAGRKGVGKGPQNKGGLQAPPGKGDGKGLSYKERQEQKQQELEHLLSAPLGFHGRDWPTPDERQFMEDQNTQELYCKFKPKRGHFACRTCGNLIYSFKSKIDSPSGLPSFDMCYERAVRTRASDETSSHVVFCAECGSVLGHVCIRERDRGWRSNQQHDIKSAALQYLRNDPPQVPPEVTLDLGPEMPTAKRLGLVLCREYPLGMDGAKLVVSRGSLVDFQGEAVVNAANQSLGAGEGINGALRAAGGPPLIQAMEAVPVTKQSDGRAPRCPAGAARLTIGGNLKAKWCIHAVGPNYEASSREGNPIEQSDALLTSAYRSAMACAESQGITTLGFSLLSTGIFRGDRSLQVVLKLAVDAVRVGTYVGLKEVHLVSFDGSEIPDLIAMCDESDVPTLVFENASCVHPDHSEALTPFCLGREKPLLWLGNRSIAENVPALRLLRVTHVVNCAMSQVSSPLLHVEENHRCVTYCQLDLDDSPKIEPAQEEVARNSDSDGDVCIPFDSRAPEAFRRAADFIHNAMCSSPTDDMGAPVIFVHCAGGVSRSCCVVLAYLVAKVGLTLREAYAQVKRLRPVIAPNAGFFRLLLDLERSMHGTETMRRPVTVHQRSYEPVDA